MFAGRFDAAQIHQHVLFVALLGNLLQHLAVADHGIERRAQFVTHVGHELALRAVGRFGGFLGMQHFVFGTLAV